MSRAVFLDRDGVLIEDVNLLTSEGQVRVLLGVPAALNRLRTAGFELVVISNQTVVARGLATEREVAQVNTYIFESIRSMGGPKMEAIYICPHHPNATLPAYRVRCGCRKPEPGLLLRAAAERDIELGASFMIGDRITDIVAGAAAGCRTVLIQTGKHAELPIWTAPGVNLEVTPDFICADLPAAAAWIIAQS